MSKKRTLVVTNGRERHVFYVNPGPIEVFEADAAEPSWLTNDDYPDRFRRWASTGDLLFAIGYNRYGYVVGHGYVVVCKYSDMDCGLMEAVDNLDAGDSDAFDAARKVFSSDAWIGVHANPVIAMQQAVDKAYNHWVDIDREMYGTDHPKR